MVQFKLQSVVLALYELVLWLVMPFSPIKYLFSQAHQSLNHQGHHHIDVPSNNIASSSSSSSLSLQSQLSSPLSALSTSSSFMNFSSSSSSSTSSRMDEFLGTDSGVCMGSNEDLLQLLSSPRNVESYTLSKRNCLILKQRNDRRVKDKNHPPVLPLLARTGNLPGRYPWVLDREYVDGRLILKETRIERYEYFEAQREHGRLVLNLVPLNDPLSCCGSSPKGKDVEKELY